MLPKASWWAEAQRPRREGVRGEKRVLGLQALQGWQARLVFSRSQIKTYNGVCSEPAVHLLATAFACSRAAEGRFIFKLPFRLLFDDVASMGAVVALCVFSTFDQNLGLTMSDKFVDVEKEPPAKWQRLPELQRTFPFGLANPATARTPPKPLRQVHSRVLWVSQI